MNKTAIFLTPLLLGAQTIQLGKIEIEGSPGYENELISEETFLETAPMRKRITVKEALQTAGSNGDPLKALKSYAGVVSSGNDNANELYIHGSKPTETSFSIKHLPLGYVFHLGGLHSVVAAEATSRIDAYAGNFDVTYDSMGAVVDIIPKYPTGDNGGSVHIGMYDADFAYDMKAGKDTFLFISARRSYFDFIADDIMDELEKDDDDKSKKTTFTLFPQFYDAQIILSRLYENNLFSLEIVTSEDKMKLHTSINKTKDPVANGKIDSKKGFTTTGIRWEYEGDSYNAMTLLSYMRTKERMDLFDVNYFVDIKDKRIGLYHESIFDFSNHKILTGFEIAQIDAPLEAYITEPPSGDDFEPLVTDREIITLNKTFKAKRYALFVRDIWSLSKKSRLRYGIRAYKTDFQEFGSGMDPRVTLVHRPDDTITLSLGIGKYSRLPDTTHIIDGFGNPKIKTYEHSVHYSMNITKNFSKRESLIIEPYFKKFKNLAISDKTLKYRSIGSAKAYGVDITYKKSLDDFNMIFAYTYVKAKRSLNTENIRQYTFEGDIPHTLLISANYGFDSGWRVSSLFKYGSGKPYTPVIGGEESLYNGQTYKRPLYATPYSKRLPDNIDLDIQIGKKVSYANDKSLEFSIEFMNITSLLRKNRVGIKYNDDYEKEGYYYQMGFLPAFHVTYRF